MLGKFRTAVAEKVTVAASQQAKLMGRVTLIKPIIKNTMPEEVNSIAISGR
jgi:hypothetical protein